MKAKERVFNNVTEQRRKTMSKIRGKNTTIEVTFPWKRLGSVKGKSGKRK